MLKALAEVLPGPTPFPVITGVSVGAINAVVLAEGADDFPAAVKKLEALWRSIHCRSIFVSDAWPLFLRLMRWSTSFGFGWAGVETPQSLLDASPLRDLIASQVDFKRLKAMVNEGPLDALAVTASSYSTGQSVTFFQAARDRLDWTRSRRVGTATDITVDHVMASAALPVIFQSRSIDDEWFGDGALRQTAPLSPAIRLGCDHLLLIAARDGVVDDTEVVDPEQPYPSLGFLGGQLLDIVFNDNLDADVERLKRINATIGMMAPAYQHKSNLRLISTHMVRPSDDIRHLAGDHSKELPCSVKAMLSTIGAGGEPWVLPSYLTFEPGYIGALIDLGYLDGRAQLDALTPFISHPALSRQTAHGV